MDRLFSLKFCLFDYLFFFSLSIHFPLSLTLYIFISFFLSLSFHLSLFLPLFLCVYVCLFSFSLSFLPCPFTLSTSPLTSSLLSLSSPYWCLSTPSHLRTYIFMYSSFRISYTRSANPFTYSFPVLALAFMATCWSPQKAESAVWWTRFCHYEDWEAYFFNIFLSIFVSCRSSIPSLFHIVLQALPPFPFSLSLELGF